MHGQEALLGSAQTHEGAPGGQKEPQVQSAGGGGDELQGNRGSTQGSSRLKSGCEVPGWGQ